MSILNNKGVNKFLINDNTPLDKIEPQPIRKNLNSSLLE